MTFFMKFLPSTAKMFNLMIWLNHFGYFHESSQNVCRSCPCDFVLVSFTFAVQVAIQSTYTVLEIRLRPVKCKAVTRLSKHFKQLFISIQPMQSDYSVLMSTIRFSKQFPNVFIPYMLIQIVWLISYYIADKWLNQYLKRNKQNSIDFMNGLYLQCKKTGGSWKVG